MGPRQPVPVVVGSDHTVAATPAGREVVQAARFALRAIADAEAVGRRAAAGEEGLLRLGTTPTLGADALPAALAQLRADRPNLHLELRSSGDSRALRQSVVDGDLDAALVALPTSLEAGLTIAWESSQHFVVALPVDDPIAASGRPVPRRELVGRRVVALRAGEGLRAVIDGLYAELGVEPDLSLETSDREILLASVAAGLGITVVPERFHNSGPRRAPSSCRSSHDWNDGSASWCAASPRIPSSSR